MLNNENVLGSAPDGFPTFIRIRDVAKFLDITEQSVYRLVHAGVIPHYKIAGSIRFNKDEFQGFIQRKYVPEAPVVEEVVQEKPLQKKKVKSKRRKN